MINFTCTHAPALDDELLELSDPEYAVSLPETLRGTLAGRLMKEFVTNVVLDVARGPGPGQ